ncbi:hypothetical protein CBP34_13190 [Acidovorax carolinensis]|uniref:Uncharacterized protein n=1 Tax=Acidovorax carolinensis TaxID=553814 RepID=A0A240U4S5_9BURK|nr:hypothetical protein CBP34_13190 [Acidovorax carolinensis]
MLTATTRIPLDPKIADDMRRFLEAATMDTTLDPKTLGLGNRSVAEILGRLAQAYELNNGEIS